MITGLRWAVIVVVLVLVEAQEPGHGIVSLGSVVALFPLLVLLVLPDQVAGQESHTATNDEATNASIQGGVVGQDSGLGFGPFNHNFVIIVEVKFDVTRSSHLFSICMREREGRSINIWQP